MICLNSYLIGSSQAPNGNLPNSRPPTSPPTRASISKQKKYFFPLLRKKQRKKELIKLAFWKVVDLKVPTSRAPITTYRASSHVLKTSSKKVVVKGHT